MDVVIIALTAVSSVGISVLIFFLWRIARFYEVSSGEAAHSWLFLVPLVLLPAGAVCYLSVDTDFVGVPAGDLLLFAGGVSLLVASALLQQVMMEER